MDLSIVYPVAVLNLIFNDEERFLFFSRDGTTRWRVMGGQLEKNETIPQCIQREIEEELGAVKCRFWDVLDAHVFPYRDRVPIVSIFCLLGYESGEIIPASDLSAYRFKWMSLEELKSADIECPRQFELIEKALYSLRCFKGREDLSFLKSRWTYRT